MSRHENDFMVGELCLWEMKEGQHAFVSKMPRNRITSNNSAHMHGAGSDKFGTQIFYFLCLMGDKASTCL